MNSQCKCGPILCWSVQFFTLRFVCSTNVRILCKHELVQSQKYFLHSRFESFRKYCLFFFNFCNWLSDLFLAYSASSIFPILVAL
jgi:hypothetical protein